MSIIGCPMYSAELFLALIRAAILDVGSERTVPLPHLHHAPQSPLPRSGRVAEQRTRYILFDHAVLDAASLLASDPLSLKQRLGPKRHLN